MDGLVVGARPLLYVFGSTGFVLPAAAHPQPAAVNANARGARHLSPLFFKPERGGHRGWGGGYCQMRERGGGGMSTGGAEEA